MNSWPKGRKKPYTEIGISRMKCIRCGHEAKYQWQVCADKRIFRPLCAACDIELNKLVLRWARDPQWEKKSAAYAKTAH